MVKYTETRHKAKSWDHERRTVARIEATKLGLDIRFVVTSLGIQLGRRLLEESDADKVAAIVAARASGTRRIARELGVGVGTVLRPVKRRSALA